MNNSTQDLLEVIKEYWFLISVLVAFFAGYVELRLRVKTQGERLDRFENDLKDDMKEVRRDIKTLLARVGK